MCDGEKVRHAWIYGGMCEIRPPVYKLTYNKTQRFFVLPSTIICHLKVVTNEKGEAVGDVLTIIC